MGDAKGLGYQGNGPVHRQSQGRPGFDPLAALIAKVDHVGGAVPELLQQEGLAVFAGGFPYEWTLAAGAGVVQVH